MGLERYLFVMKALEQEQLAIFVFFKHDAKKMNGHSILQVQMQLLGEHLVLLIYLVKFEV